MTTKKKVETTTKTNNSLITINYKWADIEIDLSKQCPTELLEESDYIKKPYLPIKLIRAIGRVLGMKISVDDMKYQTTNTGLLLYYDVFVGIGDDVATKGTAMDFIKATAVAKSMDGQNARVKALAIKDALKRVYPFFDLEFDVEEVEPDKKADDFFDNTPKKEETKIDNSKELATIIAKINEFEDLDKLKIFLKDNKDKFTDKKNRASIIDVYRKKEAELKK